MASISREPNGRRTIQFVVGDGKRRSIRLGKISQREAEGVKWRVEALVSASLRGCPLHDEVSRWVAALDNRMADKLAKVGLIAKRQRAGDGLTMADFIDQYIDGRTDVKQSTREHLERARRDLLAFFGPDRLLTDITPGDCDGFRVYLAERLAENTLRRICGRAKTVFSGGTPQAAGGGKSVCGYERMRRTGQPEPLPLHYAGGSREGVGWKPARTPNGGWCLPWPVTAGFACPPSRWDCVGVMWTGRQVGLPSTRPKRPTKARLPGRYPYPGATPAP